LQLDQTRIAIRERSFGDILDLSLRVIRAHPAGLCVAWALGALPALALNVWLLGSGIDEELEAGLMGDQVVLFAFSQTFWLVMLLIMEAPWAAMFITLYLGQALFVERPSPRQVAVDAVRSLPQMFLFQFLIRGFLLPWVITWPVLFGMWPYLNEIILLERNPLRKSAQNAAVTSTFHRNQILHLRNTGDLFGRWALSVLLGCGLSLSVWITLTMGWALFWDDFTWDQTTLIVLPQLAVWVVLGYFSVVRFLSYLDLRIRNEGWEIELKMRAEADRLTRQVA